MKFEIYMGKGRTNIDRCHLSLLVGFSDKAGTFANRQFFPTISPKLRHMLRGYGRIYFVGCLHRGSRNLIELE